MVITDPEIEPELWTAIRDIDRRELAAQGTTPGRMAAVLAMSRRSLAIHADSGELLAVAGVVPAPPVASALAGRGGFPWCVTWPAVEAHRVEFLRASRAWHRWIAEGVDWLAGAVWERHVESVDWLRWLGYTVERDPLLVYPTGEWFHRFHAARDRVASAALKTFWRW